MKKIKLLIITFIFISCSQKDEIIEGDLAFKSVNSFNYYNLNQKTIDTWERVLDSTRQIKNPSANDISVLNYFDDLKKYKVIKSPWIKLKTKKSIINVYLKLNDYEKVKNYNSNDLILNNRKVILKMNIETRGDKIYYCKELISVKEVDGKTYTSK
ncbi:hypothetical protein [Flavobacterium sp. AED]|jgi:hypothetical protein|uniref:hypothetical protein n=1 Tax=Flavobacterium sp. AED TaxID=1423323 RepID=UPI00057C5E88|nr:hypothetical protein [Flavobacterium sp. AED]KIA85789.1 hypothetical protein OA85_11050 [Flavobacterium sp. AED]